MNLKSIDIWIDAGDGAFIAIYINVAAWYYATII